MIPKSFIQDLLNRLDIVDVIGRYVPLKKAGANYVACCPFHNEKSPSFTVSQSKQFYHCFGCGAHGTSIGFVMEHSGLGFVEAVEELARSIGMTVPRETSSRPQSKEGPDLHEVMLSAMRYYRDQLKQSQRAIEYLKQRGLTGEIAARYGIGYAPDGWQNLEAAFSNSPQGGRQGVPGGESAATPLQYQDASLLQTGLVVESDEGKKRYDRFRDRIMFPIVNQRGQVVGFGGRVLDKGEPKYLNSPETRLFEKGRELYGLYQAQKAIRASHRVLVVEGYMDVVALAQHGVDYAVATLGTATTPVHVQKLLRLVDEVIFCFDGDAAGRRAAWRALENALPQLVDGKRLAFLFLPVEHDPDSYIREYGKEAFEHLLDNALPLSSYLLQELTARVDLKTREGRSALLEHAKPLLLAISAPTIALLLRKEVAALAGISQSELEGLYAIKPVGAPVRSAPQKTRRSSLSSGRTLLRCLLAKPELGRELPVEWHTDGTETATITALVEYLKESDYEANTPAIIQQFQGSPYEAVLSAVEAELLELGEGFDVDADFQGLLEQQRRGQRDQQLKALAAKGLKGMSEQEMALYRQLTQRGAG